MIWKSQTDKEINVNVACWHTVQILLVTTDEQNLNCLNKIA